MTIKKILVALDDSPRARSVFASAVALATREGAELIALRVFSIPVGVPPEAYVIAPDALPDVLAKEAARSLDELTSDHPPSLALKREVRLGMPWQQICESAKSDGVDLIVIGAHGYKGLDRLLGTTAARVVNHADRSVLVVR